MSNSKIITYAGKYVDPLDFKPEDADIGVIAHALSNICRFTGHLSKFYSVAQHSVHVAERVMELTNDPHLGMRALLHDASEAYIADVSRPVKRHSEMGTYRMVEIAIQRAIYTKFGCLLNTTGERDWITNADNDLLGLEAVQLGGWNIDDGTGLWPDKPSFYRTIISLRPESAKYLFLGYYHDLELWAADARYTPKTRRVD